MKLLLYVFFMCGLTFIGMQNISAESLLNSTPALASASEEITTESISQNIEYQVISQYIQDYYKRIRIDTAQLIAFAIVKESQLYQVDPKLIAAIISHESGFNPNAVGQGGASGLGQIMPSNYSHLAISNPFDIKQNVSGTVKYMRRLLTVWENHPSSNAMALASYNRGVKHVARSSGNFGGRTRWYVNDILRRYALMTQIKANLINDTPS